MNKFTKLAVIAFSLVIVNQVFALDWDEKEARKKVVVENRKKCIASCLSQELNPCCLYEAANLPRPETLAYVSFRQCEKKCNEDFRKALRYIYCYNNHYSCADNVINEMNSFFVYSLTID